MLLQYLDLLTEDPVGFVQLVVMVMFAVSIAITVHEFSHAFVAGRLGDGTAGRMGRLSLNPVVHLDPLGTLLLLVVGFGWGKPVPVNPSYLRKPVKWSMAAVGSSGSLANLVTAAAIAVPLRFHLVPGPEVLLELLLYAVLFNVVLAVFNLIPVPPLDGSNIAAAVLPDRWLRALAPLARYGPMVLLGVLLVDSVLGTGIVAWAIGGVVGAVLRAFLGFSPL